MISMDHRVRIYDNIFIECLWRTVRYENVYINKYEIPRDTRHGIGKFIIITSVRTRASTTKLRPRYTTGIPQLTRMRYQEAQ